jgi:hypothetical protein
MTYEKFANIQSIQQCFQNTRYYLQNFEKEITIEKIDKLEKYINECINSITDQDNKDYFNALLILLKRLKNVLLKHIKMVEFFNTYTPESLLILLNEYDKTTFDIDINNIDEGGVAYTYIGDMFALFHVSCHIIEIFNHKGSNTNSFYFYCNNDDSEISVAPDVLVLVFQDSEILIDDFKKSRQDLYLNNVLDKTVMNKFLSLQDKIEYNGHVYYLDSIIPTDELNEYNKDECLHNIAGITCQNEKYIYNGWLIENDPAIRERVACKLYQVEWNDILRNTEKSFCLDLKGCAIHDEKSKGLCYTFADDFTLIYIKKEAIPKEKKVYLKNLQPLPPKRRSAIPKS